ncbi:endonuclease/exonuclease/phosphatase family protein [Pengzhenrongella sp.]|jgi:endonuclease/exonuclease/phosphatase family metal-dependent hydrolase|uniref:endonuclease/exonuclease/phosphatase family protein n=1 Tax=Pengzhenrongella sp. TaxID=2888820 RepID=UPI002F929C7A
MADGTDLSPARDESPDLHVMTFNLRFAGDAPPNSWSERRPVVKLLLHQERPDLIGTQEGLLQQLLDIEADLPTHYAGIGTGRDGDGQGEAMQVFYNTERLTPLEFGHYWLSDTPDDPGSRSWGGCCTRMVTWVRFLDRASGAQFYELNTHFEAFSAEARTKSADLVLDRMIRQEPKLPVLLTGDFNEAGGPGGAVYDRLVTAGPFVDTWAAALTTGPRLDTFHGYLPKAPTSAAGTRIDWILSSPDVRTRASSINAYASHGQLPSDHFPVQAVVVLPKPPRG